MAEGKPLIRKAIILMQRRSWRAWANARAVPAKACQYSQDSIWCTLKNILSPGSFRSEINRLILHGKSGSNRIPVKCVKMVKSLPILVFSIN